MEFVFVVVFFVLVFKAFQPAPNPNTKKFGDGLLMDVSDADKSQDGVDWSKH